MASTKPAAPNRKLAIALRSSECLHAQGFLRSQLFDHRLRHIETMNGQAVAFRGSARKRAWQQAHDRAERVSLRARRKVRLIDHEARPERQPRIKRPLRDVYPGGDRLTQKVQQKSGELDRTQAPLLAGIRRRLAQVATTAATNPATRSPASAPVSTSQKQKKPANGKITLPRVPGRPTGGSAGLFCSSNEFMTRPTSILPELAAGPRTHQFINTNTAWRESGGGPQLAFAFL